VNYAPPGQTPDYGHGAGYGQPSHPPPAIPAGDQQPASAGQAGYPGQPGYPGYPGQPGYPGYGAPAPRKSNAPLIVVIVAVALLLCGGLATAGVLVTRSVADKAKEAVKPVTDLPTEVPELPTDEPNQPGLPTELPTDGSAGGKQITVTYEVTGDGAAEILYVDKLGGSATRLDDTKLPWKLTVQMQTPALLSVVAMRSGTDKGSIKCRALVDGKEVKSNSAGDSYFATAVCSYFDLD
jgi:hypothetical protein